MGAGAQRRGPTHSGWYAKAPVTLGFMWKRGRGELILLNTQQWGD